MSAWVLPDLPGPEVTALVDRWGVRWRRDGDLWWGDIGHGYEVHRTWPELLGRGPLEAAAS